MEAMLETAVEVCVVCGKEFEPGTCSLYPLANGALVYVSPDCDLELHPGPAVKPR